MGTFNGNPIDDLMDPAGRIYGVSHPPTDNDNMRAYEFGQTCKQHSLFFLFFFQSNSVC